MNWDKYNKSSRKEEEYIAGDTRYYGKWIKNKFVAIKKRFAFRPFKDMDEPTVVGSKGDKLLTGRKLPRK